MFAIGSWAMGLARDRRRGYSPRSVCVKDRPLGLVRAGVWVRPVWGKPGHGSLFMIVNRKGCVGGGVLGFEHYPLAAYPLYDTHANRDLLKGYVPRASALVPWYTCFGTEEQP